AFSFLVEYRRQHVVLSDDESPRAWALDRRAWSGVDLVRPAMVRVAGGRGSGRIPQAGEAAGTAAWGGAVALSGGTQWGHRRRADGGAEAGARIRVRAAAGLVRRAGAGRTGRGDGGGCPAAVAAGPARSDRGAALGWIEL